MYRRHMIMVSDLFYPKYATLFLPAQGKPKACLLYFHGGGLLYGDREDLPETHLQTMTEAGYAILAFDYPLAPAAKLPAITEDLLSSVNYYLQEREHLVGGTLPYILWGRSAGAYLCLLTAARPDLPEAPAAVVSYYGYGILTDGWIDQPCRYYTALPPIPESCLLALPAAVHGQGDLETHYSAYIFARQTGAWKSLIYEGREKYFWLEHTLRTRDSLPCPLFAAHSIQDQDVPYQEFTGLCLKYHPRRFIASAPMHDFDREDTPLTHRLLEETLEFLAELPL